MRCVAFFLNNPLEDGTWVSVTFLNWSIIEPGIYLIAACLPCFRPFIRWFRILNAAATTLGSKSNPTEVRSKRQQRQSEFESIDGGPDIHQLEGTEICKLPIRNRMADEENPVQVP